MAIDPPPLSVDLVWAGGLCFRSTDADGFELPLDGDGQTAQSPMEALLSSLCGCLAIDVVMILEKMRITPGSLRVSVSGKRNSEPPKYFTDIHLIFRLEGDVPRDKCERAVGLSFEKYCSVLHSLRKDLTVTREIEISPGQES